MNTSTFKYKRQQQGVALLIGLILLVVMTLLGVSATSTALMEEKMAGNLRDLELSLHASDTGLRDAELWLSGLVTEPTPSPTGVGGIWTFDAIDTPVNNTSWWQEVNEAWWNTAGNGVDHTTSTLTGIANDPRSVVEFVEFVDDTLEVGGAGSATGTVFYRVTTRGTGGSNQARTLLQSTWSRRYD